MSDVSFEDFVVWVKALFIDLPEAIDRDWLALYVAHKLCQSSIENAKIAKRMVTS